MEQIWKILVMEFGTVGAITEVVELMAHAEKQEKKRRRLGMSNESKTTNDPLGLKTHYEAVVGEPWSVLESNVRRNCKSQNRWMFEMLDQEQEDRIESIRLAQRPWWKKLLGDKS